MTHCHERSVESKEKGRLREECEIYITSTVLILSHKIFVKIFHPCLRLYVNYSKTHEKNKN